jgi:hypothetical protein
MAIASFDTPVRSGRSRTRTPFSSRTRTTLALIASDNFRLALELDGERQQHLGEERRQRADGTVPLSRPAGAAAHDPALC